MTLFRLAFTRPEASGLGEFGPLFEQRFESLFLQEIVAFYERLVASVRVLLREAPRKTVADAGGSRHEGLRLNKKSRLKLIHWHTGDPVVSFQPSFSFTSR